MSKPIADEFRIVRRADGSDVRVVLDPPAVVLVTDGHELRLLGHEACDLQIALSLAIARLGGKKR